MPRLFAYIAHTGGAPDETAAELLGAARTLDPGGSCTAIVTGCGADLAQVCETLRSSWPEIWKVDLEPLAYANAELVRKVLTAIVPRGSIVLVAHTHFGVDLSPGLSIKLGGAYVPDVIAIDGVEAASLHVSRQEFGGQINAHVRCDLSTGAILNIRPGAFRASTVEAANGAVIDKSGEVGELSAGRRCLAVVAAETGDIDITKEPVLVSIGRGIGDQENVAIAEELAEVLGAAVSCSRPVVDAKWLDKSRQVGSSGKTVRPRVYLACGISGSFQHLAGIKGNPYIVAINKNSKAPIFRVADVGVVDDLLEFLPLLTAKAREQLCVPGKARPKS